MTKNSDINSVVCLCYLCKILSISAK